MDWTNLKINALMELAMKFQDREHQTFIATTPVIGKAQQTPDQFLSKHQNVLLPYIKQNNQERVVHSY
jgi:hypothetical protein